MKSLAAVLILLSVAAPAVALEWKTQHLSLNPAPLQKNAEAYFEFTNTSGKPVTILGVDSSCDCLEATPSAKVIAPGASGRINARFSLADRYGQLRRTILVTTDESATPVALTVQLNVPEAAELTPRSLEWKVAAESVEQIVEIVVAPEVSLILTEVKSTSDAFATRLETIRPGKHYRLHVSPRSTHNAASAAFRLHGRGADGQAIVFSAFGNVR
ncbi:DUF1573 domain-containing protein [Oleiharenicola lentus]|uniref:DUF1573 domain-containing protein n=1 Tax=Oleiharenicola lentus TaxID=2508720 RepID=A0A4Q1C9Z2_9BACT|nr:DUF1573 domain-containing protein [Oleiharenicola lentus]RXK55798.1 DUF1573 domain-containing protein [Oleiharenicola lentus]